MKSVALGLRPRSSGKQCFHGKRVEFLCDLNGKLLLLSGNFVVSSDQSHSPEIHYTGRLDPRDLPLSEYVFRLNTSHLDSVVPTKDRSARAEYFMEQPVQARLSLTKDFARRAESLVAVELD